MRELPSKWATVDVSYGEKRAHLCSTDCASFQFHATEADADKEIKKSLEAGVEMVAKLRVAGLFRASVTVIQAE